MASEMNLRGIIDSLPLCNLTNEIQFIFHACHIHITANYIISYNQMLRRCECDMSLMHDLSFPLRDFRTGVF